MALVNNTYETYQAIGRREDLSNTIYDISPADVPFMSMIGRTRASNTLHEWQTDALASASDNIQKEGDEFAYDSVTPTVRLGNYTQISRKTVIVSGSQQAANNAGRDSEIAYQLAKSSKELKRDMEHGLTQNNAKAAGSSGTGRESGGLETWLRTNTSRKTDASPTAGADPSAAGASAATDGSTTRALTEDLLKTVIKSCYSSGGEPSVVMVGPHNKTVISGFTGRSQARQMVDEDKILGAASMYASDFGDLKIIPNRFQRERTAFVLDPEFWGIAYYRDFQQGEVAPTGDAIKRFLLVEWCLESRNEGASGCVADLAAS